MVSHLTKNLPRTFEVLGRVVDGLDESSSSNESDESLPLHEAATSRLQKK